MTKRTVLAAGLAVLGLLVGGHWTLDRQPPVSVIAAPAARDGDPVESTPTPVETTPPPIVEPLPTTPGTDTAPTLAPAAGTPKSTEEAGCGTCGAKRLTGNENVALTFDDGPSAQWTPKILDTLREYDVKATFCLVGTEAQRYPALVSRIVREGHTLCNHSWHHELDLGSRPEDEIRANLSRTNDAIRRAVPGASIAYFRAPGGEWTATGVKIAREMGMTPLGWDVDPKDWAKPTPEVISKRIAAAARPGSIVLMHDAGGDRSSTLGACPTVIPDLERRFGVTQLG